jgi:guanine deaminase
MSTIGIRGTFFDFVDDPWKHVGNEKAAARFHRDGLLVMKDGVIGDFGAYDEVAARHAGLAITEIKDRVIVPGFIDGHIHLPQTRVLGAFGEQLLPWLQMSIYPEEVKYKDRNYAREGVKRFLDALLAAGTTTCQAFTSSSPVATEELFDEASRRNMRIISGLTGIDRNAPADFIDTPENFYRDSKRLIAQYHNKGRNLYAITPRFAFGASPELLIGVPAAEARASRLLGQYPYLGEPGRMSRRGDRASRLPGLSQRV